MKRNLFGQPQPGNYAELVEVIDEFEIDPERATVFIDNDPDEEPPFTGWTAEIVGENDVVINTLGWPSEDVLRGDLSTAGFTDVERI